MCLVATTRESWVRDLTRECIEANPGPLYVFWPRIQSRLKGSEWQDSEVLARFVAWVATLSSKRKAAVVRTKAILENIKQYENDNPGDAAFIAVVKQKMQEEEEKASEELGARVKIRREREADTEATADNPPQKRNMTTKEFEQPDNTQPKLWQALELRNNFSQGEWNGEFVKWLSSKTIALVRDVNSTEYVIKVVKHLYDDYDDHGEREAKALRILQGRHHTIKLLAFEKMHYHDLDYYIFKLPLYSGSGRFSPSSERESWTYFKQVLKALSYCHKNNIIHLDITPSNIFYTQAQGKLRVVLSDFGFAHFGSPNASSINYGTIQYMPPEVLGRNDCCLDGTVDVWSAGIVFAEQIIQKDQLFLCNMADTLVSDFPVELANPPYFHGRFGKLLRKMLRLHPNERATATDALSELEDITFK